MASREPHYRHPNRSSPRSYPESHGNRPAYDGGRVSRPPRRQPERPAPVYYGHDGRAYYPRPAHRPSSNRPPYTFGSSSSNPRVSRFDSDDSEDESAKVEEQQKQEEERKRMEAEKINDHQVERIVDILNKKTQ